MEQSTQTINTNAPESGTVKERSCLNCSAPLAGDFCPKCGQASDVERYSLSTLSRETYNAIRKIDVTTTSVTFWQLFRRPGTFVREYLSGKRVGFSGPVKFFFYAFVVELLVRGWINSAVGRGLLPETSIASVGVQMFDFASALFWGLLWRVFFFRSGYNAAECAVAALYFQGQVNYFSVVLLMVMVPVKLLSPSMATYFDGVEIIPTVVYATIFAKGVFGESLPRTLIKQAILAVLFIVLFIAAAGLGFLLWSKFTNAVGS